MKVNFRLKPSKIGKDGRCPILIDFFIKGKRTIIFSGEKCTPGSKTWNGRRVIGKEPFKDLINARLDSYELKIQQIETDAIRNGAEVTPELIKSKYKEKEAKEKVNDINLKEVSKFETSSDFFDLFRKFISDTKSGVRKTERGKKMGTGIVKIYNLTYNHLKNFAEKKKYYLTFDTINDDFYNRFCNYLWDDLKHYDNNAGKTIKSLKTFLSWSERTTEHKRKYFRVMSEEKDILVISPEQLNFLIDKEINLESVVATYKKNEWPIEKETIEETAQMLERTKDILIIGCTTTLRVSDLLKLTKDHNLIISNNYKLKVFTSKTAKDVLIDLPPYAQEIIDKYLNKYKTLLPPISTQKFNDNLKKLGKFVGWDKINIAVTRTKRYEPITSVIPMSTLLTSHIMRRTGITTLLIAGMNEYAVRRISGHSKNSKSFGKYIEFSQQYINQEFQAAWENIRSWGYDKNSKKANEV